MPKRTKEILATAAIVGLAATAGKAIINNKENNSAASGKSKAELITEQNREKIFMLAAEHPDVYSVADDPEHPGLLKVSMIVQPGHNSISFLADAVAFNQKDGLAAAESYSSTDGIVQYGEKISVDFNPSTGLIVPKPELDSSAQSSG